MNQGWIKLHRKLLDNPLWTEKREFSRAECWIDILMNVQHTDEVQEVLIKNKLIECARGESIKSLDTWASRWGMSKSKARRVLNLFQSMNMIVLEDVRVSTRLRVLQFSEYNDPWNGNETEMKRKRNGNETRLNPDKNVKKVKNERMKEDIESYDSRASGDSLKPAEVKPSKKEIEKLQEEGFAIFWAAYPKKKSKITAFKAWKKIKPVPTIADAQKLAQIVRMHSEQPNWNKDGGQFIPYPATWLNQEAWNDSLETTTTDAYASTDW